MLQFTKKAEVLLFLFQNTWIPACAGMTKVVSYLRRTAHVILT